MFGLIGHAGPISQKTIPLNASPPITFNSEKMGEQSRLVLVALTSSSGISDSLPNHSALQNLIDQIKPKIHNFKPDAFEELLLIFKKLCSDKKDNLQEIPEAIRQEICEIYASYCINLLEKNRDSVLALLYGLKLKEFFQIDSNSVEWQKSMSAAFFDILKEKNAHSKEFILNFDVLLEIFAPIPQPGVPGVQFQIYLDMLTRIDIEAWFIALIQKIMNSKKTIVFSPEDIHSMISSFDRFHLSHKNSKKLTLKNMINFYVFLTEKYVLAENPELKQSIAVSLLQKMSKANSLTYNEFCRAFHFLSWNLKIDEIQDFFQTSRPLLESCFTIKIIEDGEKSEMQMNVEKIDCLINFFANNILPLAHALSKPVKDQIIYNLINCALNRLLNSLTTLEHEDLLLVAKSIALLIPKNHNMVLDNRKKVLNILYHSAVIESKVKKKNSIGPNKLQDLWQSIGDTLKIDSSWFNMFQNLFLEVAKNSDLGKGKRAKLLDLLIVTYAKTFSIIKDVDDLSLHAAHAFISTTEKSKSHLTAKDEIYRLTQNYLLSKTPNYRFPQEHKTILSKILISEALTLKETLALLGLCSHFEDLLPGFYSGILPSLILKFKKESQIKHSDLLYLYTLLIEPANADFLSSYIHEVLPILNKPFVFDDFEVLFSEFKKVPEKSPKEVGQNYTKDLETIMDRILVNKHMESPTAKYLRTRLALHWLLAAEERLIFYKKFVAKICTKLNSDDGDKQTSLWRSCVHQFKHFPLNQIKKEILSLVSYANERFDVSKKGLAPNEDLTFKIDFKDINKTIDEKRDLLYRLPSITFNPYDPLEPRCVVTTKDLAIEWFNLQNSRDVLIDFDKSPRSLPGSPRNSPRAASRESSPRRGRGVPDIL